MENNKNKRTVIYKMFTSFIFSPIVFCCTISIVLIYVNKGGNLKVFGLDANIIALVVALLGVAASIFNAVYTFKKDSNTIGTVKADTSEIKPKIDNIKEYTKNTNDILRDKLIHDINKITEGVEILDKVDRELDFQNKIKNQISSSIQNEDYLLNSIKEIYQKNAQLNIDLRNKEIELSNAKRSIQVKEEEIEILNNELASLRKEIRKFRDNEIER